MQYNGGHDYYLLKNIFIIFKKRKINEEIVEIPKNKIYTTINTILYTTLKMLSSLLNSFHETLGQYGSFIFLTVVSIFIANVVARY